MTQYIAMPVKEGNGCEGCCFLDDRPWHTPCSRPDTVPDCQQTDEQRNVKEFIYEVKP